MSISEWRTSYWIPVPPASAGPATRDTSGRLLERGQARSGSEYMVVDAQLKDEDPSVFTLGEYRPWEGGPRQAGLVRDTTRPELIEDRLSCA